MFSKCPKCKNTWQYPIEKCPECFSALEKMLSKEIKVIGISKTNIPTIFHPKTPYFVLLLEDENGNRWVQKSIKEYKIGDIVEFPRALDRKGVAIWRIKYDVSEAIEKTVELSGGLDIGPETKILVLPTLISPKHSYFSDNTSPQFLTAAIQYLLKNGIKPENITVGGQSSNEIPVGVLAQKSQLLQVCQNFKVLALDLKTSKDTLNKDLIINLPIMKIGESSASQNILRLLPKEGLKDIFTLAEANRIQKPDGLCANLGLVLASFNSLNLDRVFWEITMKKDLPELLKEIRIEDIPLAGREIVEVQYDIEKYG